MTRPTTDAFAATLASGSTCASGDVALGATLASGSTCASGDVALAATLVPGSTLQRRDARLGSYRLERKIGAGGMGVVYAAFDTRLGRHVAIKVMASGESSDAWSARFDREARITARLQHPGIVSLLDAGTSPNGAPFYAMKLVVGRSLDAAIDASTDLAARLQLLPHVIAAADAIAYAHREGVVHRDLKPHNVLVGEYGETVVIDWGLAKALRSGLDEPATDAQLARGADHTVAGAVMGTPMYMSAEQARGDAADERTDVYALGAMLYHALAGEPPYARQPPHAIVDAVVEGPPAALDGLAPDVPSELVTITNKAMARDACDRYASAKELAEELKRFQAGQLVGSHRYTARQLVVRWVQRHWAAVSVAAVALVVLIVVGIAGVYRIVGEQREASRARDRADLHRADAETRRGEAEALLEFLLFDLKDKLQPLGKLELLDAVAAKASAYYDGRPEALTDDDLYKRATIRGHLGDVLRAKGDGPAALVEYRVSLAMLGQLVARDPRRAVVHRDRSRAHGSIGAVLHAQGDTAGALAAVRDALAISRVLVATDPANPDWQRELGRSHDKLGDFLIASDVEAALAAFRQGLTIAQRLVARDPDHATWRRDLSISHEKVGDAVLIQGDTAAALASFRASRELRARQVARDPHDTNAQRDLSVSHQKIGNVLLARGDRAGALAEFRADLAIARNLAARDPSNLGWRRDLAASHEKVGDVLLATGDSLGALAAFRTCRELASALSAQDPSNAGWRRDLARSHDKVGDALLARADLDGALAEFEASLAITRQLSARAPDSLDWKLDLFVSYYKVSTALRGRRPAAALVELARARTAIEELVAAAPDNVEWQLYLSVVRFESGTLLLDRRDTAAALVEYRAALAIRERLAAIDAGNPERQRYVTEVREAIARCERAHAR